MNKEQLNSRATALMTRLNGMGFTLNGKPLVIDQAFELVAAEEGFRNQHALRAKMKSAVSVASPAISSSELLSIFARTLAALETPDDLSDEEKRHVIEDAAGMLTMLETSAVSSSLDVLIPRSLDEVFAKAICVQHTLDESDWAYAAEAWELIVSEASKRAGKQPCTSADEEVARNGWRDFSAAKGFSAAQKVKYLESFLEHSNLMSEFNAYAAEVIIQDEVHAPEVSDAFAVSTVAYKCQGKGFEELTQDLLEAQRIAILKKLGYSISVTANWEHNPTFREGKELGSPAEVWKEAWEDAERRARLKAGLSVKNWAALTPNERLVNVETVLAWEIKHELASEAFSRHRFGGSVIIAGTGDWEWPANTNLGVRDVYLKPGTQPHGKQEKYRFTVEIVDGKVVSTSLSK